MPVSSPGHLVSLAANKRRVSRSRDHTRPMRGHHTMSLLQPVCITSHIYFKQNDCYTIHNVMSDKTQGILNRLFLPLCTFSEEKADYYK